MISCKNSVKNVTSLNCILLHVITPIHTCRHVVLCRYSGLFLHTKNDLHFPSRKLDPSLKKELPAAWGLLTFLANFIPNIGGPVRNLVSPDLKWKVVFPPWKINMEHNNNNNNNHRGLEDHFSFLNGWFACSMLIFQGETLFETQNLSWFEEDFDDFSIWSPESFFGGPKIWGSEMCNVDPSWVHTTYRPFFLPQVISIVPCVISILDERKTLYQVPKMVSLRCLLAQHAPKSIPVLQNLQQPRGCCSLLRPIPASFQHSELCGAHSLWPKRGVFLRGWSWNLMKSTVIFWWFGLQSSHGFSWHGC